MADNLTILEALNKTVLATKSYVDSKLINKVDKEAGKGLSTNDLTNALKANYDAAYAHSQTNHFSGLYSDLTEKPDLSIYAPKDGPVFTTAISMGRKTNTTVGANSVALGSNVTASEEASHAEGAGSIASGIYSHAEGRSTTASNVSSHAEGYNTTASGNHSHAEGYYTTASGENTHAEGYYTIAASDFQHIQGKYNIEDTTNKYAHIVGNGKNSTNRSNAHTLDWNGNAWYAGDVQANNIPYVRTKTAIVTIPASSLSYIESQDIYAPTQALNFNFTYSKDKRYTIECLGIEEYITVDDSAAPTYSLITYGSRYAAQLYYASASQNQFMITFDGNNPETIPDIVLYEYDIKELDRMLLPSDLNIHNSISISRKGEIGAVSTSLGLYNEASGDFSFATGQMSIARGAGSFAEGTMAKAYGEMSHASGYNTIASGEMQYVMGRMNIEDTENKYSLIVGNGNDTRSNAYTLDWNGNGVYAGKVTVGAAPTENMDVATKQYVDNTIAGVSGESGVDEDILNSNLTDLFGFVTVN